MNTLTTMQETFVSDIRTIIIRLCFIQKKKYVHLQRKNNT